MKLIVECIKKYKWLFIFGLLLKLAASMLELLIPYVLEYIIDTVAPTENLRHALLWGVGMIALAVITRAVNVFANRIAVKQASLSTYNVRKSLFESVMRLSGNQVDAFGLPSLTSRMTADSYNVQNFLRAVQTMGVRAPILLFGGIVITMTMDAGLSAILCVITPVLLAVIIIISRRGIPLYEEVQNSLDAIVRIMRENITGIRVVKSLSKEKYETARYAEANRRMTHNDRRASILMALPGPIMTLALNVGLTAVVIVGARRVNAGLTQPGVILAFLTYFNQILFGVMGLNRIFMLASKANASADRIAAVIDQPEDLRRIDPAEAAHTDSDAYIVFDGVSFNYGEDADDEDESRFAHEGRKKTLADVSFEIRRGGSLGIIGATGSGKTTLVNLLMRFYDADAGHVFVDGRDVRTYELQELRKKFGVVFQNDAVFADTISGNISFGRQVDAEGVRTAAEDACAAEFIGEYADGYGHRSEIRGSNFSGGQKQRLLIARALAARPEILVLDDASSALDYGTDAKLRKALKENYADATSIVIAQRISSIMNLDEIIVIDEGTVIGKGTHEELLKNCVKYRDIYMTQMGERR